MLFLIWFQAVVRLFLFGKNTWKPKQQNHKRFPNLVIASLLWRTFGKYNNNYYLFRNKFNRTEPPTIFVPFCSPHFNGSKLCWKQTGLKMKTWKISRLEINLFMKVISPWLSFSLIETQVFFLFFFSLSFWLVMLLYLLSESNYYP